VIEKDKCVGLDLKLSHVMWSGRLTNPSLFKEYCAQLQHLFELLSILVFGMMNQAATWSDSVTSIPSLNFTPVMTFAR